MTKGFAFCKTSEEDQKILRAFEKPSPEQAGCFARYLAKNMDMIKEDNTMNSEKVTQQFKDYDVTPPAEGLAGVNIDSDEFIPRFYAFTSKYKKDIKFAFYGNSE